MNREIKFRAWHKNEKEMIFITNLDFMKSSFDEKFTNKSKGYGKDGYNKYINRNEIFLMEYTGLKDKNGVEIYEGDFLLLSYLNYRGYQKENFQIKSESFFEDIYYLKSIQKTVNTLKNESYYIKVIGNIYQNPELLKQ